MIKAVQRLLSGVKNKPSEIREDPEFYKIASVLLEEISLEESAQKVVDLMVKAMGSPGGALLLVDKETNLAHPFTVSNTPLVKVALGLLRIPYRDHKYPIDEPVNLVGRTIKENKIFTGNKLRDFLAPEPSALICDGMQGVVGSQFLISLPLYSKGEVMGASLFTFLEKELDEATLEKIKHFNDIAGSVLANSILFEKSEEQKENLGVKNVELEKALRELKAARQREKDMMDIMGHELRTPLSIIKMSISLLHNKLKTAKNFEEIQKYTLRIEDALDRETKLLERMLSSTKIDANRMELHLERLNIIQLIDDTILGVTQAAQGKNITIKFERPSKDIVVFADKIRLAEVLDNFMNNAVKYTPQGSVEIYLEETGNLLKISISDTGLGIPKEAIPHLGKKFFRVGQYGDKKPEEIMEIAPEDLPIVRPGGTGLGLYVSFELVKRMGGVVTVDSEEGKGSTFSFTVPLYKGQQEKQEGNKEDKDVFKRMGFTQSPQ